jgi:outer membrane protein OmpA-like peptidoglycan-associated protein
MPGYAHKGRSGTLTIQAFARRGAIRSHAQAACVLASLGLAGCSDPVQTPVDLFHGLEGGEIAAERPPPPGAGEPYPHVGTVPPRPVMPTQAFRTALQGQLAAERDQKELLAADLPMEKVPPPPGGASNPSPPTARAAPDALTQPVAEGASSTDADASANATIPAADTPPPAQMAQPAPPPPPKDAQLQIVGDAPQFGTLPLVPDAPPPPATFEGVPPQPNPTPRVAPHPLPLPPGKPVFFATGSDVVTRSQKETLGAVKGSLGKGSIEIIGLGDAESDSPLGQEAAIDLALRRARAIAEAFEAMHVPQSALRLAARPYGRGALVHVLP